MYVLVRMQEDPAAVTLEEPADCTRFHVAIEGDGDEEALRRALTGSGFGRLVSRDQAYIEVETVRRLARGRVDDGWPERFQAMLEYAARKGWLDETGTAIAAHCEWQTAARPATG
ncbi:hypothetical protein [Thermobispora bispora]|uniref:hypothetical protein n=1 Tax=Thermobispora bispora TaxID=2006 RepID=UPI00197D7964|nr:hypothetical protein [Thermobispora bispora]QSI48901.1 hypothetical protein CYL17_14390 [Thermobispora bispora]